jgi:ABC-type nitrate/sulfonate/bicarbonate transport system substrate-binding protein
MSDGKMSELDFAYVGLGVHEEVVYSVADQLGYYADEGVRVSIRDGVRWDDERLRQAAVVGLGRTLLIRLLAGTPWTMLCVNTEHPLFWLMARAEFADVSELRGRRVAMHPALVAPGCFTRIILRGRGLDPDTDIEAVPMHPGDYGEHIRMLGSGELDAAVIGSTWSPEQLVAEQGLRLLLFFGDELRIPTTGVAVDPGVVALDDPRATGVVRANLRALGTMLADPALGAEHVGRLLPAADAGTARDFYDRYVGAHFKADGRPDADVVAKALRLVADELRIITGHAVDVPPGDQIYRADLTAAWSP